MPSVFFSPWTAVRRDSTTAPTLAPRLKTTLTGWAGRSASGSAGTAGEAGACSATGAVPGAAMPGNPGCTGAEACCAAYEASAGWEKSSE